MVAVVSNMINTKTTHHNRTRPPLLPPDSDNVISPRRPKSREVTSRYLSTSSSSSSSSSSSVSMRRFASPLVSRTTPSMTTPTSVIKRSQSTERRRPVAPSSESIDLKGNGASGELSAAQKMLFTSTRRLSVSFQGESFSLRVNKAKPSPSPSPSSARKCTPERRKTPATTPGRGTDHTENSRPTEKQRWPGRLRQSNSMTRSVDCTDERNKLGGSVVRALQSSMIDNRTSCIGRTISDLAIADKEKKDELVNVSSSAVRPDIIASDTDSVSSGSNSSGLQEGSGNNGVVNCGGGQGPRPSRAIVVPARFWQEPKNRLRRQSELGSPVTKNNGPKTMATPKIIVPKRFGFDTPASSPSPKGVVNNRGQLSPIRYPVRPASPSKVATPARSSPMRGTSPCRLRNGVGGAFSSNLSNTPSILSFCADVRSGKIGENRVFDAHSLRLFYNRLLQWRFVNARAKASLSAQKLNAEKSLYDAWVITSKLRESVRAKRAELQLLRQTLKLIFILKGQMICLEDWAIMDTEYCGSLSGAIEALRASTLRLPLDNGAKVEVHSLKDAISSAVDVLQGMASSICLLMSKVGEVNYLASELTNTTAKERGMLNHCKDILSSIAAMQVTESSLRTHIVQQQRAPSNQLTTNL